MWCWCPDEGLKTHHNMAEKQKAMDCVLEEENAWGGLSLY